jgi:ATP-dependent RNA helicase SUPV3L1/SUV3
MRRLRENTTLETEIKKTGEVVVEGHAIGRLDGFTFAPDAPEGGSDAKALHAAARSALAGEIDARATKVSQAPERDFVLSSDGTLRWTGAPIGKLIPGDDVLRPRVRVIADDQLTGASRDVVQARLDLWLKTHIERLLGPLFVLAAAEDVTGIARGVAFQLIEAIGVLERQKVAEEVKGLDQPSRATLRKYGIRFGAYHLYLPGLLKPAPRSLAAQLWMLKHESPEAKGLDDLQRLAGSGRTSIPVDAETPKALYRTVGYRICGERAIRVDILERLADLIRPALAWREGATGSKPAGAFDGRGFTVTGAMTSLTGASGEDFASILRSLGYRMEKRPKPLEEAKPVEAAAAETPAAEATAEAAPVEATADAADAVPADETVEAPAAAKSILPDGPEFVTPPTPSPDLVPEPTADAIAQPDATAEAPPATEAIAAAAPAEPEMVEVWRPGRPPGSNQRRREAEKHGGGRRHRRPEAAKTDGQPTADGAVAAAPAEGAAADATPGSEGERKERHGRSRHRRHGGGERKDGEGREQRADNRPKRPDGDRKGPRPERGDRPDRGPRRDRDRGRDKGPDRIWGTSEAPRSGKEPDPNSPFAKLLALKAQLETNKERP